MFSAFTLSTSLSHNFKGAADHILGTKSKEKLTGDEIKY